GETPLIADSRTGGVPSDRSAIVTDAMTPKVDEWAYRVYPQIAESDATIVGHFLKLGRDLQNFGDAVQRLIDGRQRSEEDNQTYQRWLGSNPGPWDMTKVIEKQGVEANLKMAQANLEAATTTAVVRYRTCHVTLDALDRALKRAARL